MFVSATITSGLFFLAFVLITYIVDGHEIQRTPFVSNPIGQNGFNLPLIHLQEAMANIYFMVMFTASYITLWSDDFIAAGLFCFISFFLFAADTYFSLVNAEIIGAVKLKNPFKRHPTPEMSNSHQPGPDMSQIGQPVPGTIPPSPNSGVMSSNPPPYTHFGPNDNPSFSDKSMIHPDQPSVIEPSDTISEKH